MTYQPSFLCRSGDEAETTEEALERLFDELLRVGPLGGERLVPFDRETAVYELSTQRTAGEEAPDWLNLELYVGWSLSPSMSSGPTGRGAGGSGGEVLATITSAAAIRTGPWPSGGKRRRRRTLVRLRYRRGRDGHQGMNRADSPVK
ncbi:hypothetical protein GCM10022221_30530 [Actinocorallia aurea]